MAKEHAKGMRFTLKTIALTLIALGIAIAAILLRPTKESATMIPSSTPPENASTLPPIDLQAPAETKTATFAMG